MDPLSTLVVAIGLAGLLVTLFSVAGVSVQLTISREDRDKESEDTP